MHKDGCVWCFMSTKGFAKFIPYMSSYKIGRLLNKLEKEKGIIRVGNYNKSALNQTLWYAFTDAAIKELSSLGYDFAILQNAVSENAKYKEYNNIEVNITDNTLSELNNSSKDIYQQDGLFIEFWSKYNKSVDKKKAFIAFKRLSKKDKLAAIAAIEAYRNSKGQNNKYIKNPTTYIHDRTWENDFADYNKKIAFYDIQPTDSDKEKQYKEWMRQNYPDIENTALPLSYADFVVLRKDYGQEELLNAIDVMYREIYRYRKADIAQVLKSYLADEEDDV